MTTVDRAEVSRMAHQLSHEGPMGHGYSTAVKEAEKAAVGGDVEREAFWRAVAGALTIREAAP